ncbi:MAG: 30S ribosomal protein S24e [Candidatus Ranarchaeia archaeon]
MPYKIEILNEKQNPLLHRREIDAKIDHSDGSTPTRLEIRDQIAAMLTVDKKVVFVISLRTQAGTRKTHGRIHVYESLDFAKRLEPKYIHLRNTPKEETKEES